MSSYCENPEFYNETRPVARKNHSCCECRQLIPEGVRYVRCAGQYDGAMFWEAQHEDCRDFAAELNGTYGREEGCFIAFGDVENAVRNFDDWPLHPTAAQIESIRARWDAIKNGHAAEAHG